MTDATTNKHQSFYQPGELGMMLRHYREQAGMDVEQIAEELCLSPSAVVALENENFSTLPEPPYVRGYLRSYARLAGMDGKELIGMYESMRRDTAGTSSTLVDSTSTAKSSKMKTKAKQAKNKSGQGSNKKIFAILAVIVALLLLLWMASSGMFKQSGEETTEPVTLGENENLELNSTASGNVETESTEGIASTEAQTETAKLLSSASGVLGDRPETQTQEKKTDQENAGTEAQNTAVVEDQQKAQDSQQAPTELAVEKETGAGAAAIVAVEKKDVSVNPADVAEVVRNMDKEKAESNEGLSEEQKDIASAAEGENTQAGAAEAESTESGKQTETASTEAENAEAETEVQHSKIRLVFREDVWLTITDKNGERVLRELAKGGTEKVLEAEKPLKFSVGNSYGLEIHDGEELFNHTPYIKPSGTSRFTLE